MMVTIEAFLRKVWHWFNPDEWMSRVLNLSKTRDASAAPGLVMIQIDGLGFTQVQHAIKKGNMPFLARLLRRERYVNRRHYSGLPSNTPGVQGALFYGVKGCVPAFSFRDSQSGKLFNMFSPESASAVENCIKDKGEPLLKGGSAYGNIFTGGAKEAHFCAASMGWGGLLKAISPWGVPLTIVLNFHIFFRAVLLAVIEFVLAIIDSIRGILSGRNFLSELKFIPLRVTVCILLREIIAAGARIDISRGLPVIHINLGGYDEQAHHRGPTSAFAHWSLRGIDSAIARIWKAAHRSPRREYTVFIYSDHGQEEAVFYQDEEGKSLKEAIHQLLKEKITSCQWQTEFNQQSHQWRAHLLHDKPPKRLEVISSTDKEATTRAIITSLGPVGHIYMPEIFSLEEKEKIALRLIVLAKIPMVMMPCGPGQVCAWDSKGKYTLPEDAEKVIEPSHPFFKEVVRDLVELCHHPDSGELIIFGWRKGRKSLTFNREQGSHAGPGPEETSGFALLPMEAVPRFYKDTIYTRDLRDAAFRAQERKNEDAGVPPEGDLPMTGPATLRIMTYNVHRCMGRDGRISPNRIAKIIARHDPDIIALQELGMNEESHQAQMIAHKLAMTFHFHPSLSVKKGYRGNAILSKYPMRLVRNGSLPKLPGAHFLETRGALWVEIEAYGKKIQVINTHLSLSPRERFLQMKTLVGSEWLGHPDCKDPVIFCGDFNASAHSAIFKNVSSVKNAHFDFKGHRFIKTLPSFYPMGLVDHIFVGPGLRTVTIEVPRAGLERISSDHLPLMVDVQFE